MSPRRTRSGRTVVSAAAESAAAAHGKRRGPRVGGGGHSTAQVQRTAAAARRRRGRGERRREVYVTEMRDPRRWEVREVIDCEGAVQRGVWYREHDDTWCHRYTVSKSPMLSKMFEGKAPAHDEMLGLIAARTYRANEIITIYTGEDIGAVEGVLDAQKGYHKIFRGVSEG